MTEATMTAGMTTAPARNPGVEAIFYERRPTWLPIPILGLTLLPFISMLSGGSDALNDAAWLLLTFLLLYYTYLELKAFPRRFGVGGLVLFGGSLIFFCTDYLMIWFGGATFEGKEAGVYASQVDSELLASGTMHHFLFIAAAAAGLTINWGDRGAKLLARTPQPANPTTMLVLLTVMVFVGLLPYALFAREPFHVALWKDMWAMRQRGAGPQWLTGRTGNLNFNWGGYLGQLFQIGRFGALMAVFYALFLARSRGAKLFCWFLWLIWTALAFGSGTRGQIIFMGVPAVAMIYLKHQAQFAQAFRQRRVKPYIIPVLITIALYGVIQVQGHVRNRGLATLGEAVAKTDKFVAPEGNEMFTHALWIFQMIPEHHAFFANGFPGEGAIRAIPQTVFYAAIGPIPRALWPDKPIDPLSIWSSVARAGGTAAHGTTVANGLVGYWYGNFGLSGIILGGLFWAWMLMAFDKTIWYARGKPLLILIALAGHVFMFRTYRSMNWNMLYPLLIGVAALWALSFLTAKVRHRPVTVHASR